MSHIKQHRNNTRHQICLAERAFFLKGARRGSKTFWRHIKQSSGLGHLKQFIHPRPWAHSTQARVSANKLNQHFVDSVNKILSVLKSKPAANSSGISNEINENNNLSFNFTPLTADDVTKAIKTYLTAPAKELMASTLRC